LDFHKGNTNPEGEHTVSVGVQYPVISSLMVQASCNSRVAWRLLLAHDVGGIRWRLSACDRQGWGCRQVKVWPLAQSLREAYSEISSVTWALEAPLLPGGTLPGVLVLSMPTYCVIYYYMPTYCVIYYYMSTYCTIYYYMPTYCAVYSMPLTADHAWSAAQPTAS